MILTALFLAPLAQDLSVSGPATPTPFATRRIRVTNTGLTIAGVTGYETQFEGSRIAFRTDEDGDDQDLNGDGDLHDQVVLVHDIATGTTLNTAVQFDDEFELRGDHLTVLTTEQMTGLDVTGDGDLSDRFLAVYDLTTGQQTILPYAVAYDGWRQKDGVVAFAVDEVAQGPVNLNGDIDYQDQVAFVYQIATDTVTNTGYPLVSNFGFDEEQIAGGVFAFHFAEEDQFYSDFTGDGDKTDELLVLHDLSTGTSELLENSESGFALTDGPFLYCVHEDSDGVGQDLDGDGSLGDLVLHRYDPDSGVSTNLGVASGGTLRRSEGRAVTTLLEFGVADYNGDGDMFDGVVHLVDEIDGSLTNLGVAASGAGTGFHDGVLYVLVSEQSQGMSLNGDPDHQDLVLHVLGNGETVLKNAGLTADIPLHGAPRPTAFLAEANGRKMLPFLAQENANDVDLDGNGSVLGYVLQIYHLNNHVTFNTQIPVAHNHFDVQGDVVYFPLHENVVGEDLNGDGDSTDWVMHVYFPATDELLNTRLAITKGFSSEYRGQGRTLALGVNELAHFGEDLNGDGDTDDSVLHWIRVY